MSIYGPRVCTEWRRTGRTRGRPTWYGKIVLQVEEERQLGQCVGPAETDWSVDQRRWRDAAPREFFIEIEGRF